MSAPMTITGERGILGKIGEVALPGANVADTLTAWLAETSTEDDQSL